MSATTPQPSRDTTAGPLDAVIIGAGITGLHQLYRLRELGLDALVLEAGSGVGGTWFWNRYPGARFDSESYSYGYFFSPELRDSWMWSEEYAGQPETERYLNHAADTLGLRPFIELDTRVASAVFDEFSQLWDVTAEDGTIRRARYLISAVGILSAPAFPRVPGLEDFQGEWHHTGLWPTTPVDFTGKRVAVIGTGSSGVQVIPFVAREADHVTVFQRTANWCTPLSNHPIGAEQAAEIRRTFDEIHETCLTTPGGFIHRPLEVGAMDVSDAERTAHFERLYDRPGLTMLLNNFRDIATDKDANAAVTDFIRGKIRARVDDPAVAEKLIPDDHTFGMKRPPLENGFYEAFNQPNVDLVSLRHEPLERFTTTGIETTAGVHEVDLIVLATGFDAATGSIVRIDIRGEGGRSLVDHWAEGPRTHLGVQSAGFPNLFFVGGPQSTTGNIPRSTEGQVDFVTDLIAALIDRNLTVASTTAAAEDAWTDHVASTVRGSVLEEAESWAFGSNVPGKRRAYLLYAGGIPRYRSECDRVRDKNYSGFVLS